ncbi:MAG: filamentous hemagglutinin N-terminal domain-containing protein [Planctomycetota bacterium]|jgi:filamentous hemagglutinin
MGNIRKISKKYYLRQIVSCMLVYFMFFNPALVYATSNPVQVAGDTIAGVTGAGTDLTEVLMGDSSRAVINWDSLDTLSTQELHFLKTTGNFAVLNRVILGDATQFLGKLYGNQGDIFIVNTRGIFFGPDSYVSARNFVASGIDIANNDFMQVVQPDDDQFQFERDSSGYDFDHLIGDVTNEGIGTDHGIHAEQVALIGRKVTNKGIITTTAPGGAVVMAAGESVYLSEFGSNVSVEVAQGYTRPYEHVVDNGGSDGTGAGTITATGGKVILAAGDIYSTAIEGVESLRAEATGDITLNGAIGATGHVEILGGQNRIISRHAQININEDITAGSMRIKNGKDVEPGEESLSGIYVAEGKNLTATDGDVVVEAVHNVGLGGDVTATGDVFINGDEDGWGDPKGEDYNPRPYGGGDVIANNITAGGNVDIKGNAIQLNGNVSAMGGDLTITGRTSKDNYTDFSETGLDVEWGYIDVAENKMLRASDNVVLIDAFGSGGDEEPPAGEMDLLGDGWLRIWAEGGSIQTQGPFGEGVKITVEDLTWSWLLMEQADPLNLVDYSFGNQNKTALYLRSSNGSITAVDSSQSLSGKNENAADQWALIKANAYTDITLQGHDASRDISAGLLTSNAADFDTGNITVTSDNRKVLLGEDVTANQGSIAITAIDPTNGGIESGGDILASDGITLFGEVTANGEGSQTFDAGNGTLWAKDTLSTITKTTEGGLTLGGDTLVNLDGIEDSVWVQAGPLSIEDSLDAEGNLKAHGIIHLQGTTNNVAGDILSTGSGILIDHDVDADGVGDQVFDAGTGQLIAENEADIDKVTAGSLTLAGDAGIELGGNVTGTGMESGDKLTFENNVNADGTGAAQDQRFDAGLGALDADGSITKTEDGKLNLGGEEGIELGGNVETHDGDLTLEDAVTANGGNQRFDADGVGTDLIAADDIIKTTAGNLTLGAGTQPDAQIELAGDVTTSNGHLILWDKVIANGTGNQVFDADGTGMDLIADDDIIKTTAGNLTLGAGTQPDAQIELPGDVTATDGDLTFWDQVIANGSGNQKFDAVTGKLLATDTITKTTTGNLEIFGGYNGPLYPDMDYSVHTQAVSVDDGELSIAGNATVRLDGSIYSKGKMTLAANADGILSTPSSPTSNPPLVSYDNLIHNSGTIQSLNGDVDLSGINVALNGGSNPTDAYVSAGGDILLRDYTWVQYSRKLDAGDDIVLAEGKRLQGNGSLSLVAGDDIIIGSTDVDNHWLAPEDDTGIPSEVKANGDLILNAVDDVYVHGELITLDGSGGDIEITASDDTIHLYGNVTADQTDGGDIILHANTEVADGVTLDAGDDVVLAGGKSITGNGNLTLEAGDDILLGISNVANHWLNQGIGSAGNVTSNGDMVLDAGDDIYGHGVVESDGILDVDADGDIRLKANVSSVDEMTMDAGSNIELNRSSGNTSSESTIALNAGDSISVGRPFSGEGNVTANGNMDLIAGTDSGDNVKVLGKLTTTNGGNINVEAGGDIKLFGSFNGPEFESAQADGDLTLHAGYDIDVLGDLASNNGSIELSSDVGTTYLGGNVTAAVDVTLNNNTEFDDDDDQKVDAQTGTITAKGWLWKHSEWGSLYLEAAGDISLAIGAECRSSPKTARYSRRVVTMTP